MTLPRIGAAIVGRALVLAPPCVFGPVLRERIEARTVPHVVGALDPSTLAVDIARPCPPFAAARRLSTVISTNQFKNGTHIDVDGTVFRIVEFQHVKPGKRKAFVRSSSSGSTMAR